MKNLSNEMREEIVNSLKRDLEYAYEDKRFWFDKCNQMSIEERTTPQPGGSVEARYVHACRWVRVTTEALEWVERIEL